MNICQSSPKYDYDKQYTKRMAKYQGTVDLESSAGNRMEHDYFTTVSVRACDIDENSAGEAVSSLEDLVSQPEVYPRSVPDMLPDYFKDLTPEGLFALWGNSVTTGQASALKRPQQMLGIGLAEASRPDREELLREGNYLQAPFPATVYLGKSYRDALSKLGGRRIQLAGCSAGALDPADDAWSKKLQLEVEGPTVYGWSVVALCCDMDSSMRISSCLSRLASSSSTVNTTVTGRFLRPVCDGSRKPCCCHPLAGVGPAV